jgi:hypothetical protein
MTMRVERSATYELVSDQGEHFVVAWLEQKGPNSWTFKLFDEKVDLTKEALVALYDLFDAATKDL